MLGIPEAYLGHAAGLSTSVLWTATSFFFTSAGRRVGPTAVNASRILFAIVMLGVTHRVLSGAWVPDVVGRQVLYLAVSGIVGLSIGDQALFAAFVYIGPRLAMLIMTTAPLFAAFFGWLALGETLSPIAWLGVGLTIGGVAWVVLERRPGGAGPTEPHRLRGILLAFVGAACQAGGLLLSKQGMGHGWLPSDQFLHPQAATLVRMVFAAVGMLPILAIHGMRERRLRAIGIRPTRTGSPRAGYLFAAAGAFGGPFLGVWMSLEAGHRVPIGMAQTLCSLPPVLILPLAWLIYKERISLRAVIGAVIAVGGVALLFVEPQ